MIFTPVIRRSPYAYAPRHVDQTFERLLGNMLLAPRTERGCHLTQDDTSYTLQLDMPGLAREHLQVAIGGNVVRIESSAEAPRSYKAAYELAQEVDAGSSSAKLENGVLSLTLAKKQPVSNAVQLTVQ